MSDSDRGGETIQQLREELAALRAEVEKLRAEIEAEERAEKPKRKRRRPRLRLIKGGGMVALIAAPLGRYWREAAAATLTGAAATAGVLAWQPEPGPGPDELRIPPSHQTTAPTKVTPSKPPSVARSPRPPARVSPSTSVSVRPSERTGTVAPTTPSERRTGEDETTPALPSVRLTSSLPSVSLPPLPTLSLPVGPGCLVTVGTIVTICVPTGQ